MGGSTPGVRVTWRTTAPPGCVASVRVNFKRSASQPVVASYTTTNTSGTQVIQNQQLRCGADYYVRVLVNGISSLGGVIQYSAPEHVVVGGKENRVQAYKATPN